MLSARFNRLFGQLVTEWDRHEAARRREDVIELYETRRRLDDVRYAIAVERGLRL